MLTSCINGIFLINTTKGTVSLLNFSLKTSASFLSYVFINKAGPLLNNSPGSGNISNRTEGCNVLPKSRYYFNKLLESPACTNIPAPIFFEIAAGTAFKVQINMIIRACLDSRSNTILKPCIFKTAVYLYPAAAVISHRSVVTAAEFMQQIGF